MLIVSVISLLLSSPLEGETEISPLCDDYPSMIEPDMQWRDDDFTSELALEAVEFLSDEFPEWLNRHVEWEQHKNGDDIEVISGEPFLGYKNRLIRLKGFILKERVLTATDDERDMHLKAYCEFRARWPIYD